MLDLVVERPREMRKLPAFAKASAGKPSFVPAPPGLRKARITCDSPSSLDLQALFEETAIPYASSSSTSISLSMFGIEMFTIFGRDFTGSPFKTSKVFGRFSSVWLSGATRGVRKSFGDEAFIKKNIK